MNRYIYIRTTSAAVRAVLADESLPWSNGVRVIPADNWAAGVEAAVMATGAPVDISRDGVTWTRLAASA